MSAGPIFVTGGAGFIGSALTRRLVGDGRPVVVIDKLTYAANLDSLAPVRHLPGFAFEQVDICDAAALTHMFERYRPTAIVHLAAESHVDRSIDGPADFVQTNLIGTYTLLEAARVYRMRATRSIRSVFRFIHVSTDEVFGSLGPDGHFDESSAYDPRSPYSATKAGSDHLVRAWLHTFDLPVIVTNCSNNYGPYQFPEKLIPLMTLNALEGRSLPVYGEGKNIRDWLHVEDHVDALVAALERGTIGDTYAIGGTGERRNLDVVRDICLLVDEMAPRLPLPRTELIEFVEDRPGHDQRYAIDASHIREQLGWQPRHSFEQGLRDTVTWYLENREWWQRVKSGEYRRERLGLANA